MSEVKDEKEGLDENKKEEMLSSKPDEEKRKTKKLAASSIIIISILGALLALFIVLLILLLVTRKQTFKILLICSGIIELIGAFVIYKVVDWRIRYICPECGTKRTRNRTLIRTEESEQTGYSNKNGVRVQYCKTTYKHVFDTDYVCPKCGCTENRIETQSGGYRQENADGSVYDHRIAPRM